MEMSKFKILILCFFCAGVSGCGIEIEMKKNEVKWGESVCSGNGGLKVLTVFSIMAPNAECNNGAEFNSIINSLKEFDE